MTQPAKHTPGPWVVQDMTENDDDTTLTIYAPIDEASIAIMDAFEQGCECFSEIRANAHLIAAAPAMYEALQEIEDQLDQFTVKAQEELGLREALNKIRGALTQAEGGK